MGIEAAIIGAALLGVGGGVASSLMNKPKVPEIPDAPVLDEVANAQKATDASNLAKKQAAAAGGMGSTILTSPLGVSGTGTGTKKTILGG